MQRLSLPSRSLALAVALTAAALFSPRPASAQFVVVDPAHIAQSVASEVTRVAQYALQGLEYAEAVQGVIHLARQIEQLDSTHAHMLDAAWGRVGQLTDAFSVLSAADASTLLDADFGAWRTRLEGGAGALLDALARMEDASLSNYLADQLDAADVIQHAALVGLYPSDPDRGTALAAAWTSSRESSDRLRAGDLATAETAGRLTALLSAAQDDIAGRRAQGELSHTALQQAQIANQLTATQIDIALAQLLAVQAQLDALARHEAELRARHRLERWFQREQDRQVALQHYRDAEEARRDAADQWGRLTVRHGN